MALYFIGASTHPCLVPSLTLSKPIIPIQHPTQPIIVSSIPITQPSSQFSISLEGFLYLRSLDPSPYAINFLLGLLRTTSNDLRRLTDSNHTGVATDGTADHALYPSIGLFPAIRYSSTSTHQRRTTSTRPSNDPRRLMGLNHAGVAINDEGRLDRRTTFILRTPGGIERV